MSKKIFYILFLSTALLIFADCAFANEYFELQHKKNVFPEKDQGVKEITIYSSNTSDKNIDGSRFKIPVPPGTQQLNMTIKKNAYNSNLCVALDKTPSCSGKNVDVPLTVNELQNNEYVHAPDSKHNEKNINYVIFDDDGYYTEKSGDSFNNYPKVVSSSSIYPDIYHDNHTEKKNYTEKLGSYVNNETYDTTGSWNNSKWIYFRFGKFYHDVSAYNVSYKIDTDHPNYNPPQSYTPSSADNDKYKLASSIDGVPVEELGEMGSTNKLDSFKSIGNFSNSAPVGTGSFVMANCCKGQGCCAGTGPMATPSGVKTAWTWFQSLFVPQLEMWGQSQEFGQDKIIQTTNESMEATNQALRDILVSYGNAKQKTDNVYDFGEISKASFSDQTENNYVQLKSHVEAEKEFSSLLNENLLEEQDKLHDSRRTYDRLNEDEDEDVSNLDLMPTNNTMSLEQSEKAVDMILQLVDPVPDGRLPDNSGETHHGKSYEVSRNLKHIRNAMPAKVIEDVISSYSPVMDKEFVSDIYKEAGFEGDPRQVTDGKISMIGYLNVMNDIRFGNSKWASQELLGMSKTGVQREMLVVESLLMEVDRRIMKRLQQIAFMLAQENSNEAQNINSYSDKMRLNAFEQLID